MRTPTYFLRLAYDGSRFHGVPRQPGHLTLTDIVAGAVFHATGRQLRAFTAAARTDAGVHARDQHVSFRVDAAPPDPVFLALLRSALPAGVRALELRGVARGYQARGSSSTRHYRYRILAGTALQHPRAWWVGGALDGAAMRDLASRLVGTRDFSAFRHPRCGAASPVCSVTRLQVQMRAVAGGQLVLVDVEADRFLRQMVRLLVGSLVGAGLRRHAVSDEVAALEARVLRDPRRAAPAHGLFLQRVNAVTPGRVGGAC